MRERPFTILSTAELPIEPVKNTPDFVAVNVIPFTKIFARTDEPTYLLIDGFTTSKITAVFTSANAVKIVGARLKQKPKWKIYCIRNETRIAVVNWFGAESIVKFASNASHLSQQMISDGVTKAVFFCGDQRLDILPDNLYKHGVNLTELIVYDTRLIPERVDDKTDAILFFSPTAVRSFFSMNVLSPETIVFAMGNTTAKALDQYTGNPVIISPQADKAFVLNMAVQYAASHPIF
jgi:uroporphyrinogen-III synthase